MKIGVISDTHVLGDTSLPKKLMEDFKTADMVLHAGDITDPKIIDALKKVCKNVIAVYGNMDPADIRRGLKDKEIIAAGKHTIGLMHGAGHPAQLIEWLGEAFKKDKVDVIVFGHSHAPVNEVRNGVLFFNPGSATDKVFASANYYGILEINDTVKGKIIPL